MPNFSSRQTRTTPKRKSGDYEIKNNVPLFAFDADRSATGRPRSKRQLKAVARFDPSSFDGQSGRRGKASACKVGHGFNCPRCSAVCSYDSRVCGGCRLRCYYEAGIGVVTLKERRLSVLEQLTDDEEVVETDVVEEIGVATAGASRGESIEERGGNSPAVRRVSESPAARPAPGKKNARGLRARKRKEDAPLPAADPAEGFPAGWITRRYRRNGKGKGRTDRFWYSPGEEIEFRYKSEALRFLGELGRAAADEETAAATPSFERRGKGAAPSAGVFESDGDRRGEGADGDVDDARAPSPRVRPREAREEAAEYSTERRLPEARSRISALTERLSTALDEKAGLTDALQSMREEARIQAARIAELESFIESHTPNGKMPAGGTGGGGSGTAASPRACTEIGSEDGADRLRERNSGLEAELRASERVARGLRSRLGAADRERRESQGDLKKATAENLRLALELTGLEAKYRNAAATNKTTTSSHASVADRLTGERDELARLARKAAPEVPMPNDETIPSDTRARKPSGTRGSDPNLPKTKGKKKKKGQIQKATRPNNARNDLKRATAENSRLASELTGLQARYGDATASNETTASSAAEVADLAAQISRSTNESVGLARLAREATPGVPIPNDEIVPTDTRVQKPSRLTDPDLPNTKGKRKRKGRAGKATRPKNAPLFAFGAVKEDAGANGTGRPKRRPKRVARFDPASPDGGRAGCRVGHGFDCPGCASACSYDSRACAACGLECYYEAGIGVVTLEERPGGHGSSTKLPIRKNVDEPDDVV